MFSINFAILTGKKYINTDFKRSQNVDWSLRPLVKTHQRA